MFNQKLCWKSDNFVSDFQQKNVGFPTFGMKKFNRTSNGNERQFHVSGFVIPIAIPGVSSTKASSAST